jgi:hypothetical protein
MTRAKLFGWFVIVTLLVTILLLHILIGGGIRNSPMIIPAFWVAIFFHEIGHLIGAMLMGFQIQLFTIWPIFVTRNSAKSPLKIGFGQKVTFASGAVGFVTTNMTALRRRRAITIICGPIANLLTGIVSLWVAMILLQGKFSENTIIYSPNTQVAIVFSSFLGILSLLLFISTFLHVEIGDGHELRHLWHNTPIAVRGNAMHMIASELWYGKRFRECNSEWIEQAIFVEDESLEMIYAYNLAYLYVMDLKQIEQGGIYLDKIMALCEKHKHADKSLFALECAFYAGLYRDDAEAARWWFNKGRRTKYQSINISKSGYLMVEAAVMLVEGNLEKAQHCVECAYNKLDKTLSAGIIQMQHDSLEEITKQIQIHQEAIAEEVKANDD